MNERRPTDAYGERWRKWGDKPPGLKAASTTQMTMTVSVRSGFRIVWTVFKSSVWAWLHRTSVTFYIGSDE